MNHFIFETPIWVMVVIAVGILAFAAIIAAAFMAPEGYEDDSGYHDGTETTNDRKECPRCYGDEEVTNLDNESIPATHLVMEKCLRCGGRGYVETNNE